LTLSLFEKIEAVCIPTTLICFLIIYVANLGWNGKTLLGAILMIVGSIAMSLGLALFAIFVADVFDGSI
jgi:hypothetical protein